MTGDRITQIDTGGARMEHATVKACTDAGLIIHGPAGVATAQIAVGCLVEPAAGDRVLVSREAKECYVLSVLARDSTNRQINIPGSLSVRAERLDLHGSEGMGLRGDNRVDVQTQELAVASGRTELNSDEFTASGTQAHAHFRRASLTASVIEVVSDRLVQCARQAVRRIEEVETLHVGNLVQRVRENLISRSKRTSMTASKDVHVDGERIHMG